MQALFDLVQSLAKEEKRLYNLHGRNSRFKNIYKGYSQATEYSKNLDRELYQKYFSTFSKAFYSMQKNALLDDLLAVLLEYSNSSKEDFVINRYKAKYEVLNYRGFHDQALNYIRGALDACEKIKAPRLRLRILEDYRDTLARSSSATWEEYSEILARIEGTSQMVADNALLEEDRKKLQVLTRSSENVPENYDSYKALSREILESISTQSSEKGSPEVAGEAFESEYLYSKAFEDKYELHGRLLRLEKQSLTDNFPRDIRLQIVNLLMESALECGDFLLINGLIYKTNKLIEGLTPVQRAAFLPRYYELCGIYFFYENDLQQAQEELNKFLALEDTDEDQLLRVYYHKIAVLIAANLPRTAHETMEEMFGRFKGLQNEISVKLMELIIYIEMNKREEAKAKITKLRVQIRKSPEARKLSHIKTFLDMVQRLLERKTVKFQEIAAFVTDWNELLKLNLWLAAKVDNQFYYNCILRYWQERKQVVRV